MISSRLLACALALLMTVAVGACSSESAAPLPEAGPLLEQAAKTTSEITSAHVTLQVNGKSSGLPIQRLEGDLTREGGKAAAKGTAKMKVMGQLVSVRFVLTDGTLYVQGPTGGYQKIPRSMASAIPDPSAMLNPEQGISKILRSVRDAKTVAREKVGDTPTLKVTGSAPAGSLEVLLPSLSSKTDVTFWLAEARGHQPVKAELTLPSGGNAKPATAVVTLSQVNKPVTVTPPA